MNLQTCTIDKIDKIYPEVALVFYSSGNVSRHKLYNVNGQFAMGSGQLLSKGSLTKLLNSRQKKVSVQDEYSPLLPPNVIIASQSVLGWVSEPRQQTMWFSKRSYAGVPWPRLLFVAKNDELRVFAIKVTRKNISMDTKLYHAPLMNINGAGRLCFGSAENPRNVLLDSIPVYEKALYDSAFTHSNNPQTLNKKGDVDNIALESFWKSLRNTCKFPNHQLAKSRYRLKDIIQ